MREEKKYKAILLVLRKIIVVLFYNLGKINKKTHDQWSDTSISFSNWSKPFQSLQKTEVNWNNS